mmetsp:Transcript_28281/g.34349  ORF Transcript_28281/g.34349 Transcript_28281/m.34349 type:complete len:858 (-) Transcript_28281:68-2641(-)
MADLSSSSPRPKETPLELNYEKLIGLFKGEYSSVLEDRHIGVVDRVCRVNSEGFAIRDLPHIEVILNFLMQKIVEGKGETFGESLCKLLRTLSLPFVRRTATDEFKMFNNISRIIECISRVFCPNVPHSAQICAAEVLAEFASAHGQRPSVVDSCDDQLAGSNKSTPRQYHTNQRLLERSGAIPSTVRHGFTPAIKTEDQELQIAIMNSLLQFSYSTENAKQIVNAGVLSPLTYALDREPNDPLVFTGIELLWNLLENADAAKDIAASARVCEAFAGSISTIARSLILKGYRISDKELRNEVLLVSSMAAREDETRVALMNCGHLRDLLAVATTPEIPEQTVILKPFCMTKEVEDFEMRKLSWLTVCELCQNKGCLAMAVERGFIQTLLMYLDRNQSQNPGITKWARGQVHDLQKQALATLHRLVPLDPASFQAMEGNDLLLKFIMEVTDNDLLQAALRLLRLNSSLPVFKEELGELGALELALEMFTNPGSAHSSREHAVAILSLLCTDMEVNQKIFRKLEGIKAVKNALVGLKDVDHTLPTAYATQVVDCLWNAIVANRKTLARFLAMDGMEALMDLLEVCNAYLYPVILSCLADILENPKSHPFFHEWRSSTNHILAPQLLLNIWRNEENARKMTSELGVITNINRPMSGDGTRTEWIPSLDTSYSFQSEDKKSLMKSLTEVVTGEKILAKVYSVFTNLGFDSIDYVTDKDKATVETIRQYVKFKQGEVWQDVQVDFDLAQMRPTLPDRERLQAGMDKCEQVAKELASKQQRLIAENNEKLESSNTTFYENRSEMYTQEANAKIYKRNLSTLTMKERLEAKLKKEQMLKNSFKPSLTVGLGAPDLDSAPEVQAA